MWNASLDKAFKHGEVQVVALARLNCEVINLSLGSELLVVAYEDHLLRLWRKRREDVCLQYFCSAHLIRCEAQEFGHQQIHQACTRQCSADSFSNLLQSLQWPQLNLFVHHRNKSRRPHWNLAVVFLIE